MNQNDMLHLAPHMDLPKSGLGMMPALSPAQIKKKEA